MSKPYRKQEGADTDIRRERGKKTDRQLLLESHLFAVAKRTVEHC